MTVVTKEEISIMDLEIIESVAKTLCLSSRDVSQIHFLSASSCSLK